ncbi:hypothetical protein NGM10_11120 [Halorussus salilacus]|uniref:hypothetical protein n=1 Tax=Halorussus salilacus TaxID=2953750 RepID=UPI0020A1D845|nr:hypothetical protein [Halorussus salilacus]USZ67280.1 hypothetical protein NGM10_11120 [Halorussus salilacus]
MPLNIYLQEKCARCGNVRDKLDEHKVEYDAYFLPPEDSDIEALEFPISEPVLVEPETAPNGIVGHDEIIEWITARYEK